MNKIKSVLFAAGISLALAFTFSCSSSDYSGDGISSNSLVVSVSSSSVAVSRNSSSSESMKYCVYQEMRQCFETYQERCPSSGELSDFCPYEGSSVASSSSSIVPSSSSAVSSSSSETPSSSSILSSSSIAPSSSSLAPSSSSVMPSSSSEMLSSSSEAPSSSSILSSSSIVSSSSSFIVISGTFTDDRDGKSYKWVKIGTQIWMAQNLNYNVSGRKCYDNSETNCEKYGSLYNWNTAMTVCPSGWHLPSNADWNTLMKFVNPSCSDNSTCDNAGTKLKARSGWIDYDGKPGNDTYGFSALPGGYGYSAGSFFSSVGYSGYWWSASEYNSYAYLRIMDYNYEGVNYLSSGKYYLQSVRCLQD